MRMRSGRFIVSLVLRLAVSWAKCRRRNAGRHMRVISHTPQIMSWGLITSATTWLWTKTRQSCGDLVMPSLMRPTPYWSTRPGHRSLFPDRVESPQKCMRSVMCLPGSWSVERRQNFLPQKFLMRMKWKKPGIMLLMKRKRILSWPQTVSAK